MPGRLSAGRDISIVLGALFRALFITKKNNVKLIILLVKIQ